MSDLHTQNSQPADKGAKEGTPAAVAEPTSPAATVEKNEQTKATTKGITGGATLAAKGEKILQGHKTRGNAKGEKKEKGLKKKRGSKTLGPNKLAGKLAKPKAGSSGITIATKNKKRENGASGDRAAKASKPDEGESASSKFQYTGKLQWKKGEKGAGKRKETKWATDERVEGSRRSSRTAKAPSKGGSEVATGAAPTAGGRRSSRPVRAPPKLGE